MTFTSFCLFITVVVYALSWQLRNNIPSRMSKLFAFGFETCVLHALKRSCYWSLLIVWSVKTVFQSDDVSAHRRLCRSSITVSVVVSKLWYTCWFSQSQERKWIVHFIVMCCWHSQCRRHTLRQDSASGHRAPEATATQSPEFRTRPVPSNSLDLKPWIRGYAEWSHASNAFVETANEVEPRRWAVLWTDWHILWCIS